MSQVDKVVFGTTSIEYTLQRTNRGKTVAITVRPDLSVLVAAPKGTGRILVAKTVQRKAEWIVRQQERLRGNARQVAKDCVSGETLRYLGRQYQLKVKQRANTPVCVRATMVKGCLVVWVASRWSVERRREAVQQALVSWYRDRAIQQILSAVDRLAKQLGVAVTAVEVREMKTRWGSGGPNARVRFNWRIVMAPKRLLEYVVAHELCHIRYHDHSRGFWRLLGRILPDFEQRRAELERLGPELDIC